MAKRVIENRDLKWYDISRAGSNFSCNIFGFSTSTRVSATNKTEWRDKAQMLLKMVLQTRHVWNTIVFCKELLPYEQIIFNTLCQSDPVVWLFNTRHSWIQSPYICPCRWHSPGKKSKEPRMISFLLVPHHLILVSIWWIHLQNYATRLVYLLLMIPGRHGKSQKADLIFIFPINDPRPKFWLMLTTESKLE
jgi:hypothetical protein